jgi:PHD/YefM family antitoxin component YafN of YafNO toxin-antitoxin module
MGENSMAPVKSVPASEFTRNFGRYRMRAQRQPVAVSNHGQISGYFINPEEYEEFRRYRDSRRSFATAELSEQKIKAIGTSRMHPRHAHLDRMMNRK